MAIDFTEKAKRYKAIDEIIASGKHLTWTEMIDELSRKYHIETSKTSFFRDIQQLKKTYKAPIKTTVPDGGYYYSDPTYKLPRFYTDQDAGHAAKVIKTVMDIIPDNPVYKEAKELFDSLSSEDTYWSYENQRKMKKPVTERIIFLGAPNKTVSAEMFRTIDRAMKNNLEITFNYKSYNSKETKGRIVRPYQLIYDNGNWNLHGYDTIKRALRRYTLSKMTNLKVTTTVFKLPPDYDFRELAIGSFGCVCEDEIYEYKIHLHGYAAAYSKDRIWGEEQTIIPDKKNPGPNKDGIILSFESNQFMSICRWVWQWADEAMPYEPKELVMDWIGRKKKILGVNLSGDKG